MKFIQLFNMFRYISLLIALFSCHVYGNNSNDIVKITTTKGSSETSQTSVEVEYINVPENKDVKDSDLGSPEMTLSVCLYDRFTDGVIPNARITLCDSLGAIIGCKYRSEKFDDVNKEKYSVLHIFSYKHTLPVMLKIDAPGYIPVDTLISDLAIEHLVTGNFTAFCEIPLQQIDIPMVSLSLEVVNGETLFPIKNAKVTIDDTRGNILVDSLSFSVTSSERRAYDQATYSGRVPLLQEYNLRISAKGFENASNRFKVQPETDSRGNLYYSMDNPIELTPIHEGKRLNEVTVTATRVKMVMKGDTIEYDATAFNLPRGSMLDDLIRQLPGARLNENGQISINGQFVKELLVNGREFFKGDPQVALRNLPHYTVKNLQAYYRAPAHMSQEQAEQTTDKSGFEYVLDVNLKREYLGGWISNYEIGAGSSTNQADFRWLGRVFAMTFTDLYYVAAYANANNLNNSSKAGSKGEWSKPDPSAGETKVIRGGIEYNTDWRDQKRNGVNIKVDAANETSRLGITNFAELFIPQGNSFSKGVRKTEGKVTTLSFNSEISRRFKIIRPVLGILADYKKGTSKRDEKNERTEIFNEAGSPDFENDLLYQREQIANGKNHRLNIYGFMRMAIPYGILPKEIHTNWLSVRAGYSKSKWVENGSDNIIYPSLPANNLFELLTENNPSRSHYIDISANIQLKDLPERKHIRRFNLTYGYRNEFRFGKRQIERNKSDENNDDITAPSLSGMQGWIMDVANSYLTTERTQSHELYPILSYSTKGFGIKLNPVLTFLHRSMHDYRDLTRTDLQRNDMQYNIGLTIDNNNQANSRYITFRIRNMAPSMNYLMDVRDNSNPLLVSLGNSGLKQSIQYVVTAGMSGSKTSRQRMYNLSISASKTDRAFAMARTFDQTTGVLTSRPENINGNWRIDMPMEYSRTLDRKDHIYFSNRIEPRFEHSVDYSSILGSTVRKSAVGGWNIKDNLLLRYKVTEAINLSAKVDFDWHRLNSLDNVFTTMSYFDVNYGIGFKARLPWEIDLDTDVMAYCRRGYGDPTMNRTDWVWNLQVMKTLGRSKEWTIKAIGFDLLHQLPTIKRTLTAQGTTETSYNSQPAYALLTLTYRLDIKPKRK